MEQFSMLDINISQEQLPRDAGNERWLAMRSAYFEYLRASDALECFPRPQDSSSPEQAELLALASQQRTAFERYLEARMEFLEFRFDEGRPQPVPQSADAPASSIRPLSAKLPLLLHVATIAI